MGLAASKIPIKIVHICIYIIVYILYICWEREILLIMLLHLFHYFISALEWIMRGSSLKVRFGWAHQEYAYIYGSLCLRKHSNFLPYSTNMFILQSHFAESMSWCLLLFVNSYWKIIDQIEVGGFGFTLIRWQVLVACYNTLASDTPKVAKEALSHFF